jgi:hypothetical protein
MARILCQCLCIHPQTTRTGAVHLDSESKEGGESLFVGPLCLIFLRWSSLCALTSADLFLLGDLSLSRHNHCDHLCADQHAMDVSMCRCDADVRIEMTCSVSCFSPHTTVGTVVGRVSLLLLLLLLLLLSLLSLPHSPSN